MILKDALEAYLKEEAEKDPAFAGKFRAEKLPGCVSYVTARARKHLQGRNGAVEGELIMGWGEEYFTGQKKEPHIKTWAEVKAEIEAKRKPKPKPKPGPTDDIDNGQLLFDFMEEK